MDRWSRWRQGCAGAGAALLVAALTTTLTGAAPLATPAAVTGHTASSVSTATRSQPRVGAATRTLATLQVKGRAPKTGYDRAQFGQRWRDIDRNGCDQRNDVLRRDLRKLVLKKGTRGCLVLAGTLTSAYSGKVIRFRRGPTSSMAVQIDHVVAISDAWQKGAQKLSRTRREQLANDFLNLRAVDGRSNAQKSDGDAATWLPPRKKFRCAMIATQIAVKKKYSLWVTRAERDAMTRVLRSCPSQGLPRTHRIKLGGGVEKWTTPGNVAPKRPSNVKPAPFAGGSRVTFGNCTAARKAGKAPVRRGQPGYGSHLDRDGDGVGCE